MSIRASSLLAPVAGGTLFSLGVAQARRLARGTSTDTSKAASTNGPTRTIAGALLILRPDLLHGTLRNDSASTSPSWLTHMIGVRETILGLGTWTAARTQRDASSWLLSLALIDAGEALVLLHAIRRHEIRTSPGLAFIAADAGSAATAIGLITQQRRTTGVSLRHRERQQG